MDEHRADNGDHRDVPARWVFGEVASEMDYRLWARLRGDSLCLKRREWPRLVAGRSVHARHFLHARFYHGADLLGATRGCRVAHPGAGIDGFDVERRGQSDRLSGHGLVV